VDKTVARSSLSKINSFKVYVHGKILATPVAKTEVLKYF
jgi:hypothetical protein